MKFSDLVKSFDPYETMKGDYSVWMDKNENPFDLPDEIKNDFFEELLDLEFNRYPDINSGPLRERISDFIGRDKEEIVVGSGSDDLIPLALKVFSGDYVISSSPTFGMYNFYAKKNNIKVMDIPLDDDFRINVDEIVSNAGDASAVLICSPNNPTGNKQDLDDIVEVLDTGVPVTLDSAYSEFTDEKYLDLLDDYSNLIVLKTFSKAFGAAGARIGYAVSSKEIIDYLLRIKSPFNLNSLSSKLGEILLDNYDVLDERIEFIKRERDRLIEELGDVCFPSNSNFVLVDLDAYDYLLDEGIVVREFDGKLGDKIRVTIGEREENDLVIEKLKEFKEMV